MASNKEKLIASAQKLVEKGQLEKAAKEYLKVVAEDPSDVRAWLKVGDLYARLERTAEAVDVYGKVAQRYSSQGFFLKAVAIYKQMQKLDGGANLEITRRLAELYQQLGLVPDAIAQYEQIAAFNRREGRSRDALRAFQQVVELDPQNVARRIQLAELLSTEKMAPEAVVEFTRAGELLKEQGRIDDYIKVAERNLFHAPDNRPLARELARIYIDRGDARRALSRLQACYQADPRDLETLELLATAFGALGQVQKTVSVLKELARIYREDGNAELRDEMLRRVLRISPDDDEAMAALTPPSSAARVAQPIAVPRPSHLEPDAAVGAGSYGEMPAPIDTDPPAQGSGEFEYAIDAEPEDLSAAIEDVSALIEEEPGTLDQEPLDGAAFLEPPVEPPADEVRTTAPTPATAAARASGFDGYASASAHREPHGDGDTEVAQILVEADVYAKYGLHQKAAEHLRRVFVRFPDHVAAREKLASQLAQSNHIDEAIGELWTLHGLASARHGDRFLHEILRLRPGDPDATAALADDGAHSAGHVHHGRGRVGGALADLEGPLAAALRQAADAGEGGVSPDETSFDDSALAHAELLGLSGAVSVTDEYPPVAPAGGVGAAAAWRAHDSSAEQAPTESGASLEDLLEQADALAGHGRFGEARRILDELQARYPHHPLLRAKREDLESAMAAMPIASGSPLLTSVPLRRSAPSSGHGAEEEFVGEDTTLGDLPPDAAEPADRPEELASAYAFGAPPGGDDPDGYTDAGQARDGTVAMPIPTRAEGSGMQVVDQGVQPEDYDTHYDLGIAYKEMGLLDDAIHEFRIVMQDAPREVLCHTMIGLCLVAKGQVSEAISQFKTALYAPTLDEREELALYYEMGAAYERIQDRREALYYYEKVVKRDPRFRDVERRIAALHHPAALALGHVGGGDPADNVDSAFDEMLSAADVGLSK